MFIDIAIRVRHLLQLQDTPILSGICFQLTDDPPQVIILITNIVLTEAIPRAVILSAVVPVALPYYINSMSFSFFFASVVIGGGIIPTCG